jgi:hypothetical protein
MSGETIRWPKLCDPSGTAIPRFDPMQFAPL